MGRSLTRAERKVFYELIGACKKCGGELEVLKTENKNTRRCKCVNPTCGKRQSRWFDLKEEMIKRGYDVS